VRDTSAPAGFTVSDLIFSEPILTVEHESGLSPLLCPLDHAARIVVNADHSIM